ncbi:MAG: hypothetical protein II760_01715 [Lachnospiraceae bacterium]|nr:hypothetical protein [Lachnospiraceae bacterium]
MASPAFANIVSSYGLKSNGMNAIDVIAGVPVRIGNYQGNPTVYLNTGSKETASRVAANMKDAAKNAGIMPPKASGESITFGFKKPRLAVDHYQKIRELITANAGSLNLDQCPYCFMGSCDVAGMYQGTIARRMHRACYLNKRNSDIEKINNSDGNYITGIIGAIIAAIIIVAIAEALVIGASRILYILYLGFPLFIAGGFRLGKGPYGPMGSFCHITVSILAMYFYFYIQGCWYASYMYNITMVEAFPYFGDVMKIVMDPEFLKDGAMEIVLFVIGLLIALFANPTSKKQGRKGVQQNDVFITPLSSINTGFSGADAYNPFGSVSTQNPTAEYNDPYGTQSAFGTQTSAGYQDPYASQNAFGDQTAQTSQGTNSDWVDVYAQNSDNNNNSTGF